MEEAVRDLGASRCHLPASMGGSGEGGLGGRREGRGQAIAVRICPHT